MYALIENGKVSKVGEFTFLFPDKNFPPGVDQTAFALQNGAFKIVEGERKDERFYWVSFDRYEILNNTVIRHYTSTPKDLSSVKENWVSQFKNIAHSMLATTDWVVVRKFERQVEIPVKIAEQRAQIISECSRLTAAVNSATSVDEIASAITIQNWVTPEVVSTIDITPSASAGPV